MATVYPTAAGTWSTRTWNDDATGAAYGPGTPQSGDTVHANGLAITIDVDITVAELRNDAGTTAIEGGSFTTSGTRTVNANCQASSTTCLTLTAGSGSVLNGNSVGGSSGFLPCVDVQAGCTQNGNATGGSSAFCAGSNVAGVLNGDSFGGSAGIGAQLFEGIQNGNSTGGSAAGAYGTAIYGVQIGNSNAGSASGAHGSFVSTGWQIGNANGGSTDEASGTFCSNGGIFNGQATGGTVSGSHGVVVGNHGVALITTASGATSGAFGVVSDATNRHVVIIQSESGSYPKSLSGDAETDSTNVPFVSFEGGSGGGMPLIGKGGLVY